MGSPYGLELRTRVIKDIDEGKSLVDTAKKFSVRRQTIADWLKLRKETNSLKSKSGYQKGHSHKIIDWDEFARFAEENRLLTGEAMAEKWMALKNIKMSVDVIYLALAKLNYTYKKTFRYAESKLEKQQEFLKELELIDSDMIVYSDETGIDDNEVTMFGWSKKNERCRDSKRSERKMRINITAALHKGKLFAPFLFIGYSTQVTYFVYIKDVLIPSLKPGMVLIIDNASFHKSKEIKKLIEQAGCRVLFLPPYSPEFNPIEHYWAAVKTNIKIAALKFKNNFYDATVYTLGEMCAA